MAYIPVSQRGGAPAQGGYVPVAQRQKQTPPSQRVLKSAGQAVIAEQDAQKANSISGLAKETFKPQNLGRAALDVGKEITKGLLNPFVSGGMGIGQVISRGIEKISGGKYQTPEIPRSVELPGPLKYLGEVEPYQAQFERRKEQGDSTSLAGAKTAGQLAIDEPAGIVLKPAFLVGAMLLKEAKPLARELSQIRNPNDVLSFLRDKLPGLSPQRAQEIAPKIAASTDEKAVSRMLLEASKAADETPTLQAVHNTTAAKLDFAQEQGGIANPSMAIIDTEKQGLEGYGDISLVGDKNLVREGTTYASDVYSPRHPSVMYDIPYSNQKEIEKYLERYEPLTGRQSTLDFDRIDRSLENDANFVADFLTSRGIKIPTIRDEAGSVRPYEALSAMRQIMKEQNLEDNLFKHIQDFLKGYGASPKLFAGYTYSGRRRLLDATADNASKVMNSERERAGEGFFYGLGNMRAGVTPKLPSIDAIKKNKARIVPAEAFEKSKTAMDDRLFALAEKLTKFAKFADKNNFIETDTSLRMLGEYMRFGAKSGFREKYPDLPSDILRELQELKAAMKGMPTEYFETTFRRPVRPSEFKGALVPKGTLPRVREGLEKQGLKIAEYDKNIPGDRLAQLEKNFEEYRFKIGNGKGKFDMTRDEAARELEKLFDKSEIDFVFRTRLTDGNGNPVAGYYKLKGETPFSRAYKGMIALLERNGKVSSNTVYHESFHAYFNTFLTGAERAAILSKVKQNPLTGLQRGYYGVMGYKGKDSRAEEWLADDFASFVRGPEKYDGFFRDLWERMLDHLTSLVRRVTGASDLYEKILSKERPGVLPKPKAVQRFEQESGKERRLLKSDINGINKSYGTDFDEAGDGARTLDGRGSRRNSLVSDSGERGRSVQSNKDGKAAGKVHGRLATISGNEVRALLDAGKRTSNVGVLRNELRAAGFTPDQAWYVSEHFLKMPQNVLDKNQGIELFSLPKGSGGAIQTSKNGWKFLLNANADEAFMRQTVRHELYGHVTYAFNEAYRKETNEFVMKLAKEDPDTFTKLFSNGEQDIQVQYKSYAEQSGSNLVRSILSELRKGDTDMPRAMEFLKWTTELPGSMARSLKEITPETFVSFTDQVYKEVVPHIERIYGKKAAAHIDRLFNEATYFGATDEFFAHVIGYGDARLEKLLRLFPEGSVAREVLEKTARDEQPDTPSKMLGLEGISRLSREDKPGIKPPKYGLKAGFLPRNVKEFNALDSADQEKLFGKLPQTLQDEILGLQEGGSPLTMAIRDVLGGRRTLKITDNLKTELKDALGTEYMKLFKPKKAPDGKLRYSFSTEKGRTIDELAAEVGYGEGTNELSSDDVVQAIIEEVAGRSARAKEVRTFNAAQYKLRTEKLDINRAQDVKRREQAFSAGAKRGLAKGEKMGFKKGQQETRASIVAQLRNTFGQKMSDVKRGFELDKLKTNIKNRDMDRVRDDIVVYIKENVDMKDRGRFIGMVQNTTSQRQLIKAFVKVDKAVVESTKRSITRVIKKRIAKLADAPGVDVEYRGKIKELIGNLDLKKRQMATMERLRATAQWIKDNPTATVPERVMQELSILTRKAYSDISLPELIAIHDKIDFLETLGRLKIKTKQRLYEAQKQYILDDIVATAVPLDKNPVLEAKAGEKLSTVENLKNVFPKFLNGLQHIDLSITPMDAFFDLLDGARASYDGAVYRTFKATTDRNYQTYLQMKDDIGNRVWKVAEDLELDERNFERIGIHAARVQKDGTEKLLNSGLTQKEIDAVVLTDKEKQLYDAMREELDAMRVPIEGVMKDVYNKELGKVENYFSFMTDWDAMSEAEVFQRIGEGAPEFGAMKKNPEMGFTVSRVGAGKQKIKLNAMEIFQKHIDNATYLVSMARDNRMLSEIANRPEYGEAVGDVGQRTTLEFLDLIARKGGIANDARIAPLDWLRKNVGVARLGFKLSSAIIQPTALLDGAQYIGSDAFTGMREVIVNQNVREWVLKHMPEIRARVGDDPAYRELSDNRTMRSIQEMGMYPLKWLDGLTASGVGYGAYIKKMRELNLPIDLEKPNKEALEYAQTVVRRTQSSSFFKDAPMIISRGKLTGNRSFDRAVAQFQSFLYKRWSNIKHDMYTAGIRGGRGDIKQKDFQKAFNIAFYLMLAVLAEEGLRRASTELTDLATGRDDSQDDGFTQRVAYNVLGQIPYMSPLISTMVYDSNPIPTLDAIQTIGGASRIFTGKETDTKLRGGISALETAGLITGIPGTTQAAQLGRGVLSREKESAPARGGGGLPALPKLPQLPALPQLPSL